MSNKLSTRIFRVYTTSKNYWNPLENCYFFPEDHDWDHSVLVLETTSLRQIEDHFGCKVYKIWKENRTFFHRKTNCFYEIHSVKKEFSQKEQECKNRRRECKRLYMQRKRYSQKVEKICKK